MGERRSAGLAVPWPLPRALAFACLAALLALWGRNSLAVAFDHRPLLIVMFLPILFTAYLGGLWPGLLATGLVALETLYYLLPPHRGWQVAQGHDVAQLLILAANGVAVSCLTEALHRANRRSQNLAAEQLVAAQRLRDVLTNARCLLWRATVTASEGWQADPLNECGSLHWDLVIEDETATARVLPLEVPPDGSYTTAWLASRPESHRPRMRRIAHEALLSGAAEYEQTYPCVGSDGHERWLSEQVTIHPAGPGRWELVGVCTDITRRKAAEAELRAVLTHARCILWRSDVTDPLGDARAPGDSASELHWDTAIADEHAAQQVLSLDLRSGEPYRSAFHRLREPEDKLRIDTTARRAILGGEDGYRQEFRCRDQHGRTCWLREDVTILPGPPHQWHLYGVTTDITALKTAEAEVIAINSELEQRVADRTAELAAANEELEGFAYAVSHDLRGPLRAMSGFSQALVEDFCDALPPEARGYLDQITQASHRMAALIDGLLVLSRATRGDLQRDSVDLAAMAERLLAELAAAEPERQVAWHVTPGPPVRGDARMLEVVMRNLVANAFKYTTKTLQPEVRVALRLIGDQIVCEVKDNGAGFDPSHAEKLFQPFQRLHRQDEFPGLGIGLATAQRIIRRHGGELSATAAVGLGAAFWFTLPAGQDGREGEHGEQRRSGG